MQRLAIVAIIALLAVSCAAPTPTPTPVPTPTPTPTATPTPISISAGEAEDLRLLAFAYWEAFNSYDVDRTLSYLEDSYRAEQEDKIRSDIGQIKTFRAKLHVSEKSPPEMISLTEGMMYLTMKEPIGTRTILMAFVKTGGEWKITFAEEAD